jgi:hypothetical protein
MAPRDLQPPLTLTFDPAVPSGNAAAAPPTGLNARLENRPRLLV